jgi:cation-transporting P-type ATPase F
MDSLISRHWHELPQEEIIHIMETDPDKGLSGFDVKHRHEHFGLNVLSEGKQTGALKRFLLQFNNPLVYILLASAAVTAILSEWVDFSVIFGVVFVNAIIGFIQESKAEDAIKSLSKSVTTISTVLRNGEKISIPSREITPGDIVLLESGDKVPADMRLIQSRELRINESTLTGESLPIEKNVSPLPLDTILADRTNMAYSGTLVTTGRGKGVVIGIGDNTETGRISKLISEAVSLETPLTRKISKFSSLLLYVIIGLALLTFAVGYLRKDPLFETFMAAVALAVGAIPEGLPAAITITLAIGMKRMAAKKAIIRKLPAVETLGSTTVICSDKTGTLTENRMSVQSIWTGGRKYDVDGTGYTPEGSIKKDNSGNPVNLNEEPALKECLLAGLLCNDAKLFFANGAWNIQGDPTEAALLVSAGKAGLNADEIAAGLPRLDSIPFESERQYMATLHNTGPDRPNIVYIKGSLEKILERCVDVLDSEGKTARPVFDEITASAEAMAGSGLRVIAFARKEVGNLESSLECSGAETKIPGSIICGDIISGLTFIGLQAMIDPPRPEAIQAVQVCRKAGINVKMITGDHALTASVIAERLGLQGEGIPVKAKTGRELALMTDQELSTAVMESTVFARVEPEQKLKIVDALQSRGHVVAMTGDGVNDAPALKQADIGIAMGITGTEVAKEAADMVLVDDNFSSIEAAVEEGRGIFDNLTKFIVWTLPTNLGEGLVILAGIMAGTILPILPVQILWINMTTAVLLGLMLAFEPKEPGIMNRPPRDPQQPILTQMLIFRIVIVGAILLISAFWMFQREIEIGKSHEQARTVAVNIFVMIETFYLLNCRSLDKSIFRIGVFSNPPLIAGMAAMMLLQIAFTYAPFMQKAFSTASIGLREWGFIFGFGFLAYVIVGMEKWISIKIRSQRSQARI